MQKRQLLYAAVIPMGIIAVLSFAYIKWVADAGQSYWVRWLQTNVWPKQSNSSPDNYSGVWAYFDDITHEKTSEIMIVDGTARYERLFHPHDPHNEEIMKVFTPDGSYIFVYWSNVLVYAGPVNKADSDEGPMREWDMQGKRVIRAKPAQ
jgi:lipopolysaccharide export LptBFGC system permease protein LptF